MKELEELQEKHSTRPDVFDDVEEEHAIDILTAEITQVMDEWMGGWMDEWMGGWIDGWMDWWVGNKLMDEWRDGQRPLLKLLYCF